MHGEQWVTERLRRGDPLIFPADWPESDRALSGDSFLALLLDPRWTTNPDGLVITNAVVTAAIRRRYLEIQAELAFEGCVFRDGVSLTETTFHKRVRFVGCGFERDLELDGSRFPHLELGPDGSGHATEVRGDTGFRGVEIRGSLAADGVLLAGDVDFVGARLGEVSFERARFCAKIDFGTAHVGGHMSFDGAHFAGAADFVGLHALGYTTFQGVLVPLVVAQIAGLLKKRG